MSSVFYKFDNFLGGDLKYGPLIYGGMMTVLTVYFLAAQEINWGEYVFYVIGCIPATTIWVLLLIDSTKFSYIWANWYFSFFAFVWGSIQVVLETIWLS